MTDAIEARHRFAEALAVEAGQLALEMRGRLATPDAKTPTDFVTEADLAVERLIRSRISASFGDSMIGEEDGGSASASVWVVDPIDGTTNFIHGGPRWCISLGYVRDGKIKAGVIYSPEDQRLFSARRGAGARLNGEIMEVSRLRHGVAPLIEVGRADRTPIAKYAELLTRLDNLGLTFRRRGSGALGLAEVAAGLQDGFVELEIHAWDCMAGIILVEEAGGRCNDFLANDGLTRGNLLVSGTPEVWERLMQAAEGIASGKAAG